MDRVVAAGRGVIRVTYHQFQLTDSGQYRTASIRAVNGLVGTCPGVALIHTGIHTGVVGLSAQSRDRPPPSIDLDGWDEVVEVSLTAPVGRVRVTPVETTPDPYPDLTVAGPGEYRIRVHARGRDTMIDGVATEPVEEYHLVVWPGAGGEELVFKQTDRYGAEMRESVARAPVVRQPPVDEHQARLDAYLRQIHQRYLPPSS